MAIQFARARYISRSTGGSAVRSAAYNGRDAVTAERTGELYYFRHRDAPEHHEVLLPDGAAERFRDIGHLWNAAEAAEKRKDAQVAREIVLALPANAGLSAEDRIELARSFAEQHFVSKGLAVQLDVHAPHDVESESECANWHAHLLITTRRLEGERFFARKARDLDPEVRHASGREVVADGEAWGALWRDHQNRYFREHGLDIQVDPTAAHPGQHIGPVRMRKAGAEIVERAEEIRQANEVAARDPGQVLAARTRHNATFTERDVDRYLGKHIGDDAQRTAAKAKVLEHQELVVLHDRESGKAIGRFTTRAVREQEQAALADAVALVTARNPMVPMVIARRVRHERGLREDQRRGFEHAIAPGGLAVIEGRAGTGKSYTLAAIHDAYALAGRRVIGLAPTNAVARDLAADGFGEAATVHAALFRLKNGRDRWNGRTVLVVDEAAMLDARMTGELLAAARQAGAKVILAGDDRQLASIERGGLFTELRQRHGAAEITEVTRQHVDWQRQAAQDLAERRFAKAVAAFDRAGAITWTQEQQAARKALVAAWTRDTAAQPDARRFVFAYTNRDVDALNAELRQVRRVHGELGSPDVRLATKHGEADFALGDRVQFTDTDKRLHIYNGNAGTITGLDARTGRITAKLDFGREVSWSAQEFQGFRHGYAGTIYKGQGKTLDHTYLYHTEHWRAAASYVALTRQRYSAQVFVACETARDAAQLARQMARDEVKAASIAWATPEEIAAMATRHLQAGWTGVPPPLPGARPLARDVLELNPVGSNAAEVASDSAANAREQRDALRRELLALDRCALAKAARADRVGRPWQERPMTLADAARLVSRDFASMSYRVALLRREVTDVEKAAQHYEGVLRSGQDQGDTRLRGMGLLRQVMRKAGAWRDRSLALAEDGVRLALERCTELAQWRDGLAMQAAEAEKAAAVAFEQAKPAAAAELAQRRERASVARDLTEERSKQEITS